MQAASKGHEGTVLILLDAGADPSPVNNVSSCVCVCVYVYVSLCIVCLPCHIEG
jgi:hypothetical protein